jgi:hypothetical protein
LTAADSDFTRFSVVGWSGISLPSTIALQLVVLDVVPESGAPSYEHRFLA